MKLLVPIIGGGLVLWYTREVMPEEAMADLIPFANQYPDVIHLLAAVVTFMGLAMIVKKWRQSIP